MKQICLLFLIYLTYSTISFSQNKEIYSSEFLDLGDCEIVSSSNSVQDSFVFQEFKVEVPIAGKYYISAWLNGSIYESSKKPEYMFLVNGNEPEKIKIDKSASQVVDLKEKKIDLNAGENIITVRVNKPHCPNVEFLKVSSDKQKQQISSEKFDIYIDELSKKTLPENYLEMKKTAIENEMKGNQAKLKDMELPIYNYNVDMDVDFSYTYFKWFYLSAGSTYTFETKGSQADPIMFLFRSNPPYPTSYTWDDDDGGAGVNSKIRIRIPVSGYYCLFIRSFNKYSTGVCDFYFNNSLYASNCAVSGTYVNYFKSTSGITNWFTASLTGDSHIWLEDGGGSLSAENNNNSLESDFSWGYASRIRANLGYVGGVIVTSHSSYNPTGNCDLYMNCKNSDIHTSSSFPYILSEDAIQSAVATSDYNCIAWSGGLTEGIIWPPVSGMGQPWWVDGDPLQSFDNFYADPNRRGLVQMPYTRTGATSTNSVVDLWYNENDEEYTHASVRKPGNYNPHGYAWESKPGAFMRTFHPRYALRNTASGQYGNVNKYYRQTSSTKSAMILDESIARGFCVIENIEFSNSEKQLISKVIMDMPLNQVEELKIKYTKWKKTWEKPEIAIHSNPFYYAQSDEYRDFIEYCKKLGKASWPFIFERYEKGDTYIAIAMEDLIIAENKHIWEIVKEKISLKSTATASGAAIIRLPRTYTMMFIKELLKSEYEVTNIENDGIIYSNSFDFKVYPNPTNISSQIAFNLPYDAKVSVEVLDLSGKVLSIPVYNQSLTQGNYKFQLNVPESYKGMCLAKLRINNNINLQLLVVK